MKNVTSGASPTVRICRAGIIAALYAALTYALGPMAYGPLQIRPAEALCILPIFYWEAIPGLYVGCLLANILSGYGWADMVFGPIITLLAALLTYFLGKVFAKKLPSALLGAVPPVLFNAVGIPFVIILASPGETMAAYWMYFGQLLLTQSVWLYALGIPLYFGIRKLYEKSVRGFGG